MVQQSEWIHQQADKRRYHPTRSVSHFSNPFHFDPSLMVPNLLSRDRMGAFKELIDRLYLAGNVIDSLRFLQAVLDREDQQSTSLGHGIALPHARCRSVAQPSLAFGISRSGILFPSEIHPEPVHVICMLAVPDAVPSQYLALLGRLAFCFQRASFLDGLFDCHTPGAMHRFMLHRLSNFQTGQSSSTGSVPCA